MSRLARDFFPDVSAPVTPPTDTTTTPSTTLNGRTLVWNDEFNTNGLPDSSKWAYDTSRNIDGWHNNEQQYYANARLQNSSITNGQLSVTAVRETIDKANFPDARAAGYNFSSARLITLGKFTFTYGFVEVRAKMPCSLGAWPAIWMLGSSSGSWPDIGEIDIVEQRGTNSADKQTVLATLHMRANYGGSGITASRTLPDACTAFHNYQLTWSTNKIELGVDGTVFNTYYKPAAASNANWPFDRPQFLLLNLAMGGDLGGAVPNSFTTDKMLIDYVRVYQ
jgi:beta-glucanase (GH16 family)